MIQILLNATTYAMVSLLLFKGIVSFRESMRFLDRFTGNLKEASVSVAVAWLCLVELTLFSAWVNSMWFAYTVKDNAYVGVVVIVLWMWTFAMCTISPFLAGWRGWRAILIGVVLLIAEAIGVLLTL